MMKNLFILSVPILLATTLLLATGLANVNTFGQIANQTSAAANQTSAAANQTSAAANQTSAMGNQTSAMGNQTSAMGNQTGGNLNEKLFNMTGQAISALNDDNATGAETLLSQMQQNLSQATGKQIVVSHHLILALALTHLILALALAHLILALALALILALALALTHLILALTHLILAPAKILFFFKPYLIPSYLFKQNICISSS